MARRPLFWLGAQLVKNLQNETWVAEYKLELKEKETAKWAELDKLVAVRHDTTPNFHVIICHHRQRSSTTCSLKCVRAARESSRLTRPSAGRG